MLVAVAPLHFSCGFRRGFRRVPLGPGHANVRLGAKAPCQKWQVPWPAFGRPAGFSRDPREGPAAFWWGPGRFQVPPQVPAGLRRIPSGFGWVGLGWAGGKSKQAGQGKGGAGQAGVGIAWFRDWPAWVKSQFGVGEGRWFQCFFKGFMAQ